MRSIIFTNCFALCLCWSAPAAEELAKERAEASLDVSYGAPFSEGSALGFRAKGRSVLGLNEVDSLGEFQGGLTLVDDCRWFLDPDACEKDERFDLTVGYAAREGKGAPMAGLAIDSSYGRGWRAWGYAVDARVLRLNEAWTYEGFYRVDASVCGMHVIMKNLDGFGVGAQLGTGRMFRYARFEMRGAYALEGTPRTTFTLALSVDLH